jgi:hypothetical protein
VAEKEETERVTMLWPTDLKGTVRDMVGPRGLTDFVVDAVKAKLDMPVEDPEVVESKELGEARFLVQRLADCIAMAGEYEDRESTLRELDLPPWVETTGWPENLARAINPIEPVMQPVNPQPVEQPVEEVPELAPDHGAEPLIDHEYEAGYSGFACVRMVMKDGFGQDCGAPAAAHIKPLGVGDNVIEEPPKTSHSNDLFKRLQAKAAEKGVDVSGIDLVPASQIERPEVYAGTDENGEDVYVPEPEAEEGVGEPYSDEEVAALNQEEDLPPAPTPPVNAHNHSWNLMEDPDGLYVGQAYFCACGDTMDKKRVYKRDEVPTKPAQPSPPPAPSWQTRAEQMDVDF